MGRRSGVWRLATYMILGTVLAAAIAAGGCARSDDPRDYMHLLGSEKEDVQRRGIEELARMQKRALPALTDALANDNVNMRVGALKVLARIRHSESLVVAGTKIDDPVETVQIAAITAVSTLSQVWKARAVQLLTQAMELDQPACVKLASEGLKNMRYDEATAVLQRKFESGEGIQALYAGKLLYQTEPRQEMSDLLLNSLTADDPTIREAAEANLKALKDLAVRPLVDWIAADRPGTPRARQVLDEVRAALITELDETLDSKRAEKILAALGVIADNESIDKLMADFQDRRLETVWRVAAAEGLGIAAQSPRCPRARRSEIIEVLTETMQDEGMDNRVRIGAAIALCKVRERVGVEYLLEELDRFQETVAGSAKISEAKLRDLTALRIRAQEALTESGEFVVDFLMARISRPQMVEGPDGRRIPREAGPIIVWAAAKTLGELRVEKAVPALAKYLTTKGRPVEAPADMEEGLGQIRLTDEGTFTEPIELEDWQNPSDEQLQAWRWRIEEFKYPAYVRWTVALAFGRIGGEEAGAALREAEEAELDFIDRLQRNRDQSGFYRRAPLVNDLIEEHQEVLFYIRKALEMGYPSAQRTGS